MFKVLLPNGYTEANIGCMQRWIKPDVDILMQRHVTVMGMAKLFWLIWILQNAYIYIFIYNYVYITYYFLHSNTFVFYLPIYSTELHCASKYYTCGIYFHLSRNDNWPILLSTIWLFHIYAQDMPPRRSFPNSTFLSWNKISKCKMGSCKDNWRNCFSFFL